MKNQNEYILALIESGFSIIPITEGEKKPHQILGLKHDLLINRASPEEVKKWIKAGVKSWGVAGGAVSGNLVTLDFDEKHYPGLFDLWRAKLSDDQKAIADTCHKNSTRNNGTHLHCRTQTVKPTVKLTRRVELNKKTMKAEVVTTAETRGEGSYALIPPSVDYKTIQGSLLDLPIIPDEIFEELIDVLRTFNEVEDEPTTKYEWKEGDIKSGDRPGDRLNERATWNELLGPHGWIEEEKNHWRRPGKDKGEGISATTNYDNRPMFYVFSTSASPFEANRGYSKFTTFALLNHNGDFNAAAKAATEMYPGDSSGKDGVVSIEIIEEMLKKIPSDTPKTQLKNMMEPIFEKLVKIEKITAETFLLDNVKEYFGFPKEYINKYYIPHLRGLKLKSIQDERKVKREENKLPLILDRDINFQKVYDAVLEIGIINEETLKIVIAVVISAQLRLNPPLWRFRIGVPSSFKTEFVGLVGAM